VFEAVRHSFEARLIDRVAVKGRRGEIDIYELLAPSGALDQRQRALRDQYGVGLRLYQTRHWQTAREQFLETLRLATEDGPSRVLLARCEEYLASPPPPDWNGVHVLTSK
jgi:adenylate cyclase